MAKSPIAIHTDELDIFGLDIDPINGWAPCIHPPHRDDHYIFILQQKGFSSWQLDFSEVRLRGASLFFIAPGQVHQYVSQKSAEGWSLFIEPALITKQCREIFDTYLHLRQLITIDKNDLIFGMMPVVKNVVDQETALLKKPLINALAESITTMIAERLMQSPGAVHQESGQKQKIMIRFKQLVSKKYVALKQVKDYASLLNITPLYLNEVVKQVTGFPSSYWIHQEILLEARRLLYYTDLDVKEIAYELGYEDPGYFSRFFKKNSGMTAAAFRQTNHDLSHDAH